MVGKAKLGERDQLDQIIKLVLHSSEGGSQQLSSARGRAVPVGLGQQQQQQRQSSARRVRALPVGLETSTSSSRLVAFTFLGFFVKVTDVLLIFFFGLYHFSVCHFHHFSNGLSFIKIILFQWSERGGMESKSATNAKISQHGCCIQTQQKRMNFSR